MKKLNYIFLLLFSTFILSCENNSDELKVDDDLEDTLDIYTELITKIEFGVTCGWCGYDSIKVDIQSVDFSLKNHCHNQEVHASEKTDLDDYFEIAKTFNPDSFKMVGVDSICHICYDGCDFWINVIYDGELYRITYGSQFDERINPVIDFIDKIEDYKTRLKKKYLIDENGGEEITANHIIDTTLLQDSKFYYSFGYFGDEEGMQIIKEPTHIYTNIVNEKLWEERIVEFVPKFGFEGIDTAVFVTYKGSDGASPPTQIDTFVFLIRVLPFEFEATVIGFDPGCGLENEYIIQLTNLDSSRIYSLYNSFQRTYFAYNLPDELKAKGLEIYLNARLPVGDEINICPAMGLTFPSIMVVNAIAKNK